MLSVFFAFLDLTSAWDIAHTVMPVLKGFWVWKAFRATIPAVTINVIYQTHAVRAIMAVAFPNSTYVCTEDGSTLQHEEWRLKTINQRKHASFESRSWCAAFFLADVDLCELISKLHVAEVKNLCKSSWTILICDSSSETTMIKKPRPPKGVVPLFHLLSACYSSSFASSHSKRMDMCLWPDFMSNATKKN